MDREVSCTIIDLCEHPFTEFREEMGDIHLGFVFGLDKGESC